MSSSLPTLADIRDYTTFLLEQDGGSETSPWPPTILNEMILAAHTHLVTQIKLAYEGFFEALATANIVAGDELYPWPADFHKAVRLEYRGNANETWQSIDPLEALEYRDRIQVLNGVGSSGGTSTPFMRRRAQVYYRSLGSGFMVMPFFNQAVTDGLQLFYIYHPAQPLTGAEDSWVPFGDGSVSLLPNHHELLAVGAAIRAQMRQGEQVTYQSLYSQLYSLMIDDVEQRQVQRSKHVVGREGYYQTRG